MKTFVLTTASKSQNIQSSSLRKKGFFFFFWRQQKTAVYTHMLWCNIRKIRDRLKSSLYTDTPDSLGEANTLAWILCGHPRGGRQLRQLLDETDTTAPIPSRAMSSPSAGLCSITSLLLALSCYFESQKLHEALFFLLDYVRNNPRTTGGGKQNKISARRLVPEKYHWGTIRLESTNKI